MSGSKLVVASYVLVAGSIALLGLELRATYKNAIEQERIRRNLEPNAIYAREYGSGFRNEDRDENGRFESYFRDPTIGKLHRVRINHQTGELSYTLVRE